MKKALNRPRMQTAVSSAQSTQNNFMQVEDLATFATPSTASITTTPGQSSILDLSITIENTSTNESLEIKIIEIQLPIDTGSEASNLTDIGALPEIEPSTEGSLWNLNFGTIPGEFLATPNASISNTLLPGQSAVFYLDNIKLNTTTGVATISIKIKDTNGIITNLSTTVTKQIAKAEITQFIGQPSEISPGTSSTLQWKTTQIDYCLISPGYDNPKHPLDANDSLKVKPNQDTTYTLWAYGKGVLLSSQIRISLKEPEVLDFGRNGTGPVNYGENISLYWETNDYTTSVVLEATTNVEIPPELPTTTDTPISIGPITKDTTFSLRAYDADQNESKLESLSVGVTEPLPLITQFSIYWKKNKLMASWETENASQISLKPIPNLLYASGEIELYPAYTLQTHYTLIAKNDAGDTVSKTFENTYDRLQEDTRSPIGIEGVCQSVAISPDSETIYMANNSNENFFVLDSKTLEPVPKSPVDLDARQNCVIVSEKDNRVFITTTEDNGLAILDSKTFKQIEGSPFYIGDNGAGAIAISPDFKRVYVGRQTAGKVIVLDYNTLTPINGSPMKTEKAPVSIAVSHDSSRVFVANSKDNTVLIFNAETLEPIEESPIKVGLDPSCIVISPDGNRLYIANQNDDTLSVFNAQTLLEIPESPIEVGSQPKSIALSADGRFIFVANSFDSTITILNAQTLKQTDESPLLTLPLYTLTVSNSGCIYILGVRDNEDTPFCLSVFYPDFTEVIE
ncbi:YncE family protein [uncultured Aquimarina sp.]|uniref:YncE family protein n=1 Tax=uncultured Aquimarina sp. TaxID=575652 RepID=UPI0026219D55|nr:YncE family protein [uncultured Aquimarina sp.]